MKPPLLEQLWKAAQELPIAEQIELRTRLQALAEVRFSETVIADRTREVNASRCCPHCGADRVVRHGTDARGVSRWKCRSERCGRTFGPRTGTPISRLRHREKWSRFVDLITRDFIGIRKLAEELAVSQKTAWTWRKRFLVALANESAPTLAGTVEADETYFRRAFKGSRDWQSGKPPEARAPRYHGTPAIKRGLSHYQVMVLTAVDSQKALYAEVFPGQRRFAHKLIERVAPGSLICSDGFPAYVSVAQAIGGHHVLITPPKTGAQKRARDKPRAGGPGLGRVSQLHEALETFINRRARGVSSKYLPLYIAWMDAVQRRRLSPNEVIKRAATPLVLTPSPDYDIDFRDTLATPVMTTIKRPKPIALSTQK